MKSIIGTTVLNGPVRNGKGCDHRVEPPKLKVQRSLVSSFVFLEMPAWNRSCDSTSVLGAGRACGGISRNTNELTIACAPEDGGESLENSPNGA